MDRKKIESQFNRGNFKAVLEALQTSAPDPWRDTTLLRTLRSMGNGSAALEMGNTLFERIQSGDTEYPMDKSQRNHQLRYIALVFAEQGAAKRACQIMKKLIQESPKVAALHREYAFALTSDGDLDGAEAELVRALKLQPANANSFAQLARIYCRSGRVETGYTAYSRAASLEPNNPNYLQRLIYWSNYSERTTQQSNYQLTQLWASKAFPDNKLGTNTWRTANPDRVLKIGFVSSDYCAHAVSFFVTPLFASLDRKLVKVVAYSDTTKKDHVTDSIRAECDVWRDIARKSDADVAAQISADEIDILIDLNGHTGGNRLPLFAKHLVPIQASWLGYPSTTGLKSIAYRLTDRVADPVGINEEFFSEKLVRIRNGFLCYRPLATAPEVAKTPSNQGVRFGSFNNLAKVSQLSLDCWSAVLHAVPNSSLYIKRQQLLNRNCRTAFVAEFAKRGISEDRLILKTSKAKIEQHLDEYNQVDIALDTFPYNGTTTTLEALWMGTPVVSMRGETHASRVSASILHRLELDELIADDMMGYVTIAKELALNTSKQQSLSSSLRDTMRKSALLNEAQFAREFEFALRERWREWCHQRNVEQGLEEAQTPIAGAVK